MLKRITAFSDLSFTHRLARAAFAGALALCCLGGAALAADDEDSVDTKIIKGILGINDGDSIDYRERPPLVVPPSRTLPTPGRAEAINSPAWPKDPDVAEKKRKKAADKAPRKRSDEEDRALTPAELNAPGRLARGTGGASAPSSPSDDFSQNRALRPDEMGYKGGLFGSLFKKDDGKGETAVFTGEPARTDLTQPPVGYLTPSPSHPYGLGTKKEAPKPYNSYENRVTDTAK